MLKYLFVCFLLLFSSCDDGDLQIETIDFDSITTVGTCKTVDPTAINVLFKINEDEALILELPTNYLANEVVTEPKISIVGESGPSKVIYRIFSDNVTNDYFCDDIPSIEPSVVEEIIAENGEVQVTTTTTDAITYEHTIRLNNISFITGDNSRITDLRITDFGTVSTVKP